MRFRTEDRRKPLRLGQYDYSRPGEYFVTICTKDRESRFGEIEDGEMRTNDSGAIVQSCWNDLPNHYPNVQLDEFVVMPNHVHGVIRILEQFLVGATHGHNRNDGPTVGDGLKPPVGVTQSSPLQGKRHRLGHIVGSFKSAITKRINEIHGTPGAPLWQRGYYDHIIRDDRSLTRIRDYIVRNPQQWSSDKENPEGNGKDECEGRLTTRSEESIPRGER